MLVGLVLIVLSIKLLIIWGSNLIKKHSKNKVKLAVLGDKKNYIQKSGQGAGGRWASGDFEKGCNAYLRGAPYNQSNQSIKPSKDQTLGIRTLPSGTRPGGGSKPPTGRDAGHRINTSER